MANSHENAQMWLNLLLAQNPPFNEVLSIQIAAGRVGDLCLCGCHGFGFEVPRNTNVPPLKDGNGLFYEVAFESNFPEEIDMLLFTDERGYLCCVDVMYGPNVDPMPDDIVPGKRIGAWAAEQSGYSIGVIPGRDT